MDDTTQSPAGLPPANRSILDAVAKFDWLKLPGAVRALSSIIIGAGDAGAAWIDIVKAAGEQKAREIRDTTEARSKSLSAYTDAAIASGIHDDALVKRAVDYTLVKGLREQRTREHITIEAARIIADDPPAGDTPPPSDDWLNIFASHAEKASSDRLRSHWAAVLAGEVKRPGSFSFASLHVLSILDPHTASLIEKARGWLFDIDTVPMTPGKSIGDDYADLLALSQLGLLSLNHSRTYKPSGPHIRPLGVSFLWMSFPATIRIPVSILSKTGSEIFSLAAPKFDETFASEVISYLETLGAKDVRKA